MIRLVVALAAEAKPLIHHYGLSAEPGSYLWYRSDCMSLVVSGTGKRAAAAATAYLHAKTGESPFAAWLNFGVAGHRSRLPGDLVVAHTVTDRGSGQRWYPTRLSGPPLEAVEVATVEQPETVFTDDAVFDMEASGFYSTALRFSTTELVQTLKLVSDNRTTSFARLTAARVRDLSAEALESVGSFVEHVRGLAVILSAPPLDLEPFRERFRLTATQGRKLARLLARWRILEPNAERTPTHFVGARNASEWIARLEDRLRRLAWEQPL